LVALEPLFINFGKNYLICPPHMGDWWETTCRCSATTKHRAVQSCPPYLRDIWWHTAENSVKSTGRNKHVLSESTFFFIIFHPMVCREIDVIFHVNRNRMEDWKKWCSGHFNSCRMSNIYGVFCTQESKRKSVKLESVPRSTPGAA